MDNHISYLQRFLQHYPNAVLNKDGTPYSVCRNAILGIWNERGCEFGKSCRECWNEIEDNSIEGKDDNT